MAISKTLTVNIKEDKAKANEKMFIYRNDKGIDMYISLSNLSYLFDGGANYSYVSAIFKSPSEEVHIKNGLPIVDGRIKFTFDSEIIVNMQEVGTYELQFQLFDKNSNRLTIPSYFFEVKEPLANTSVEFFDGVVDLALADYSYVSEDETSLFAIVDGYIRTDWKAGDLITSKRLNNLEEGVSLALDSLESVKDIDVVYKSNEPSTVQVGGIPIGYVTGDDGISVIDFIDAMLHPYQEPTISLSISPSATLYEIGYTLNSLNVTANATKKSNKLVELAILKNNSIIRKSTFNPPVDSSQSLYHTESNVSSDVSFSSYVSDDKKKINSNSLLVKIVSRSVRKNKIRKHYSIRLIGIHSSFFHVPFLLYSFSLSFGKLLILALSNRAFMQKIGCNTYEHILILYHLPSTHHYYFSILFFIFSF